MRVTLVHGFRVVFGGFLVIEYPDKVVSVNVHEIHGIRFRRSQGSPHRRLPKRRLDDAARERETVQREDDRESDGRGNDGTDQKPSDRFHFFLLWFLTTGKYIASCNFTVIGWMRIT